MNSSSNNIILSNYNKSIIILGIITGIVIASENWLYLGLILVPLLIYLCLKKPFIFPFGLYVLLLPFDLGLGLNVLEGTVTKYLAIITILILMFNGVSEKKLRKPDNIVIWWTLFFLYGFLSIIWANDQQLLLSRLSTAIGILIFYLVVSSYKIRESDFNTLTKCILIGGFLASVVMIYKYMENPSIRTTLDQSIDQNNLAMSLLIPFSVALSFTLRKIDRTMKLLCIIVTALLLFAIIVTGSRGGLLSAGVVIVIFVLYSRDRITIGMLILIICIILYLLIPGYYTERWESAIDSGGSGRLAIWYIGYKSLGKYWTFGAGLNNFQSACTEFSNYGTAYAHITASSHNIYLGTFVELGIFGIAFMVLAIIKHYQAIQSRFNNNKIDIIMLKASFWGVLSSSFFIYSLWAKSFWLLWMLIIMYKNISETDN